MRTETTSRDLYQFHELTEEAQDKALEQYAEMRQQFSDSWDWESIEEAMAWKFREAIGAHTDDAPAGWPAGIKVYEADVSYRTNLTLTGTLTRANAPGLPWPTDTVNALDADDAPEVDAVTLNGQSAYGLSPFAAYGGNHWQADDSPEVDTLIEAVRDAVAEALSAGIREYEYIYSRESLIEDIEANEREFLKDGSLA